MRMLGGRSKRLLKLGAIGSAVIGSGYLLQKNDWEMSTVGVVRFGRAAIAVCRYKCVKNRCSR